jgi:hypothetical protein
VPVDLDMLTAAATAVLSTPEGRRALDGAVARALAMEGAPTRPGGPAEPLIARWRRRAPLSEDTDWSAPLGPFRDRDLLPGTVGELCAARLSTGGFAAGVLARALAPLLDTVAAEHLSGALDEAERRDACLVALGRSLTGPLAEIPLPVRLPGEPASPAVHQRGVS